MDFGRSPEEEAQLKALRRQRFSNTEVEQRYKRLVAERAQRRQQLEKERVARGGKDTLSDALKFVGTCTLMCPLFEREEREMKNSLASQELIPGTRKADPEKTVKTFHRSAAGNEEPLPEDLRTPETLLRTLDHLIDTVIAGDPTLVSCHGFVRDRTRSIRQDFTIQNIRNHFTVLACERIARFHILSLHILCGHKDFEEKQDMEQLRNTLKTLIELYDDHRKAGIGCPNEAEFYAYYIVSHLHDSDAKRVAERLPSHIFLAPIVQQALRIHMLSESSDVAINRKDPGSQFAVQNMTTQFFRAVGSNETPLLLACLAEYSFPSIRRAAVKAMNYAFPYQEGKEYPVEEFAAIYAFDSVNEVKEFCSEFKLTVNRNGVKLGERVGKCIVFQEPAYQLRRTHRNLRVVGSKFHMSPMQAINATLQSHFLIPRKPSIKSSLNIPALNVSSAINSDGRKQTAASGAAITNATNGLRPKTSSKEPSIRQSQEAVAQSPLSNRMDERPPLSKGASASAFASSFTGVLDRKPTTENAGSTAVNTTAAKKRVSFAPAITASASNTGSSSLPSEGISSAVSFPSTSFTGFAPTNITTSIGTASTDPNIAKLQPEPSALSMPVQSRTLITPIIQTVSVPPKLASVPSTATSTVEPVPVPLPDIVWNKPRQRINWTSLSNMLYDNLIESLVRDVTQPVASQTKKRVIAANALADDIAAAIVDYTSAFIAYEESYRYVLLAKADSFRRKSVLRSALLRWNMESVVIQQDKALQQQYLDDLDDLIDSAYTIGQHRMYLAAADNNMDIVGSNIDSQLGLLPTCSHSSSKTNSRSHGQPSANTTAMPKDFWESEHLGRDGFDSICKALQRYGSPPFRMALGLFNMRDELVLPSWLWWQIEPSSISHPSQNEPDYRQALYSNGRQFLAFGEGDSGNSDLPLFAQIVLLSSEPIEEKDLGGSLGAATMTTTIVSRVEHALEISRSRSTHINSAPLLFVFWSSDSKTSKAVQKIVANAANASGTPSYVAIKVIALDFALSRQQFASGMKWVYRHLFQSLKSSLVKVTRAYVAIGEALIQSLRRMRNCVVGLLKFWPSNSSEAVEIFNKAISITNVFVDLLNEHILVPPKCPKAGRYPHIRTDQSIGSAYFSQRVHSSSSSECIDGLALAATNPIIGAELDEILSSGVLIGEDGMQRPILGACLRALELTVKHQLDMLQQALPVDAYTNKQAVSVAAKDVVQQSNQLVEQAARLCQQNASGSMHDQIQQSDPFTTPRAKRSSSFAFSGTPMSPLFTSVLDPATPESTAPSVSSMSTQSTVKRQRPSSSFSLSRLQSAITRASKHLK